MRTAAGFMIISDIYTTYASFVHERVRAGIRLGAGWGRAFGTLGVVNERTTQVVHGGTQHV